MHGSYTEQKSAIFFQKTGFSTYTVSVLSSKLAKEKCKDLAVYKMTIMEYTTVEYKDRPTMDTSQRVRSMKELLPVI